MGVQTSLSTDRSHAFFAAPVAMPSNGRAVESAESLADHRARVGPLPWVEPGQVDHLLSLFEEAGLTGHGGAGFPVATKWRSVPRDGSLVAVVGNGAESEPLSAKDVALLSLRPHMVIDGLVLAAEALDAQEAVLWVHAGDGMTRILDAALAERSTVDADEIPVRVLSAPATYLSGESSAIVAGLQTGRTTPVFATAPASVGGIGGRPTLVHNVETLARIGLVARQSRSLPGRHLLTIAYGPIRTVCELPQEATVEEALRLGGVPDGHDSQAVLVGGYSGAWAPWSQVANLTLAELDGARTGSDRPPRPRLGPGILAPLSSGTCGLAQTAAIADYFVASGAGQCGPCVFGTREIARLLHALAAGSAKQRDVERLRVVAGLVQGRGACALPDGLVALVRSALRVFQRDLKHHLRRGRCSDGARPTVQHELLAPMPGRR